VLCVWGGVCVTLVSMEACGTAVVAVLTGNPRRVYPSFSSSWCVRHVAKLRQNDIGLRDVVSIILRTYNLGTILSIFLFLASLTHYFASDVSDNAMIDTVVGVETSMEPCIL